MSASESLAITSLSQQERNEMIEMAKQVYRKFIEEYTVGKVGVLNEFVTPGAVSSVQKGQTFLRSWHFGSDPDPQVNVEIYGASLDDVPAGVPPHVIVHIDSKVTIKGREQVQGPKLMYNGVAFSQVQDTWKVCALSSQLGGFHDEHLFTQPPLRKHSYVKP